MEEAVFPCIETLEKLLVKAISNVFSTMLQQTVTFKKRCQCENSDSPFYELGSRDPLIIGTIGFVGEANGVVYIYLGEALANQITSMMTGLSEEELKGEFEIVKDVIGEISNMTVGSFKNGICDAGFNCRLTLPTVLRGSSLEVDSVQSARREVFLFEFENMPLVIDLFVQEGNN